MNLRQLETFVKVAETKNFSLTAKQLYLTQPTVSAQISGLEKELKTCLLVRSTKGVALSDDGKELYAYAEQMLELERKIKERFGQQSENEGSVLRVAASSLPAQYLLPEIMVRYHEKYPKEQIKLMETDSAGAVEMVMNHTADLGFNGTEPDKGNCACIPFYRDELIVIAPVHPRFERLKERPLKEWICKEGMILREEGSGTRKEAQRILASMGVSLQELDVTAIIDNSETIKHSVINGLGISILSRLAVKEEIEEGKMIAIPLAREMKYRNINLLYDAAYPGLPAAERFKSTVWEIFRTRTERPL